MSDQDEEFEAFLKRRRPLFRREVDEGLEPPAELDRIVLRQAREAIREQRPMRMFGMPRWAAPMAIAATLVLGVSIVFKAGMPPITRVPEVTVENIAQRVEYPAAPEAARMPEEVATPAPRQLSRPMASNAQPAADSAGGFVSQAESERHAPPPPPAPPVLARREASQDRAVNSAAAKAAAADNAVQPAWRLDAQSWQAEIARLRASGDAERADAEQAEYNRQHRAYAVSPDR
jgi:hypothetical protein